MSRAPQTPPNLPQPISSTGAEALHELVRLLARLAAREIVADEGCRATAPQSVEEDG
jgi:hypothetical protein